MDLPEALRPGLEGARAHVVEGPLLTRHVGGEGVFATPAMIGLMENLSHETIAAHLGDGLTTVGYEVHVRHVAPAEPGSTVNVSVRVAEVSGNKVLFEVACHEGARLIGEGIHRRAVVPRRG
ncbi:MAG: thioesterase family protein [Candidatus Dormibacterales bacterium]